MNRSIIIAALFVIPSVPLITALQDPVPVEEPCPKVIGVAVAPVAYKTVTLKSAPALKISPRTQGHVVRRTCRIRSLEQLVNAGQVRVCDTNPSPQIERPKTLL